MELLSILVDWSRAQFALTACYHWLFVPLTLGLALIMAIMETLFNRKEVDRIVLKAAKLNRNDVAGLDLRGFFLDLFHDRQIQRHGRIVFFNPQLPHFLDKEIHIISRLSTMGLKLDQQLHVQFFGPFDIFFKRRDMT